MVGQPKTPGAMVLEQCPFCGKPADLTAAEVRDDSAWCFIRCSYRCKVSPYVGESSCVFYWSEGKKYRHQSDEKAKEQATERAVQAWNTRHPPAEQTPAVGGETEEALLWLDDFVARCNGDDRGSCSALNAIRSHIAQLQADSRNLNAPHEQGVEVRDQLEALGTVKAFGPYLIEVAWRNDRAPKAGVELIDRAHVAPLLAEIERMHASYETMPEVMIRQRDRIAEPEAQQGEPVTLLPRGETFYRNRDAD